MSKGLWVDLQGSREGLGDRGVWISFWGFLSLGNRGNARASVIQAKGFNMLGGRLRLSTAKTSRSGAQRRGPNHINATSNVKSQGARGLDFQA